jgi:TRAP-type C4-dicarboxylate transport system permease small subunit
MKIDMRESLSTRLTVLATVILVGFLILSQAGANPRATSNFINFTAINEVIMSVNPLVTIVGSVIATILVLANLYGIIKGYLERRNWNKKHGESRTPVIIKLK